MTAAEQRELLERHLSLVIETNKVTNLTRIDSWESAQVLHIEDSLAGLDELQSAPAGSVADIGSGAGFPGIPLAICSARDFTLIESNGKKADTLNKMVAELGLHERVTIFHGRVEEYPAEAERFAVVTARAVSSLSSLIELAAPLLKIGGWFVSYKASCEEELDQAKALEVKLGMRVRLTREFTLSDKETFRSIVVFEKFSEPQVALPRRPGMAQKRPYKG